MKKGITWLAACMLILVLTACGGAKQSAESGSNGSDADAGVTASEELVIKASNYEFDQPEYHLKKGVPVNIVYKNENGNHGILVPELNLQLDTRNSSKVITPDKVGEFEMSCSVFCGSGHSSMISKIIVEE
ncbi:cytochrome C oxidase subunit II [Paenibacillus sp. FSL H7-0942]|uniref:Cytochrome C oxidase subunit II n=2 Tax=Paenibacillus TaxID=44249 RepID=A0ABD8B179_PAEAM|nr:MULTISPECIES: cytochrome c oxidase subunit II [Paenibacillus]APO44789.1 cytochrome C oxidase subunit II [Paenibacillus xylanexedens]ETT36627.1 cytochrome c oxidase subunit II [Paenibacillus sp. FSL R5-192]OMF09925.1 cytochrome C oxidase subunit II [Paenibacillus amylolyticus]OMF43159.1 cytochrome C oxidase subunit II [Paenibacillus amylolyticus]PKQ92634.1 cytochrome C oxidase subunit II [Paenibacillus sp. BGI2013]